MVEAFILVGLVVFFILGRLALYAYSGISRSGVINRHIYVYAILGITLNLITLFALVLAIGVVVDDAIVVIEAVHAKMETEHLKPREANDGRNEGNIGCNYCHHFLMAAVFVPVAFMSGPCGHVLPAVFNHNGYVHYFIRCCSFNIDARTLCRNFKNEHGKVKKKTPINVL